MVRGPFSMVVAGVVALLMLGLVAGGPRLFEKVLPEPVLAWLETFGTGGSGVMVVSGGTAADDETRSDNPLDMLKDTSDGWKARGPIAATAGGGAVFIDSVIAGYSARVKGDSPARTETLEPNPVCMPTAPSAEAALAHVVASQHSGLELGLATYDDADLADAVQAFARQVRTTGRKPQAKPSGLVFEAFDVAVTETAKPVYLVLEAPGGLTIFNLHLAPGARIERVVLLGGDQVGVANLPEGVPVEVSRAAELAGCGVKPFYPLNPNHLFFQSVENGAISGEELETRLADFAALETAWDIAFRTMFGAGAGAGAVESRIGGWAEGRAALAGPVPATPETRAVWASIEGSRMLLTLDQYVEYPGLAEAGQDFASKVEAIATAFAWGDLKKLKRGVNF